MADFITIALSFPTVVFSFLTALLVLYWLVASLGLVELDAVEFDVVPEADSLEGLAGLLMRLGLHGVPLTVVLTLLSLTAWTVSYFLALLLLSQLPGQWLPLLGGVAVLLLSLLAALPVTGWVIKALRPWLTRAVAPPVDSLIGRTVVVRTSKVTDSFGEAMLDEAGASLILKIRADEAEGIQRGDRVVLLDYVEETNSYRIMTEREFSGEIPFPRGRASSGPRI